MNPIFLVTSYAYASEIPTAYVIPTVCAECIWDEYEEEINNDADTETEISYKWQKISSRFMIRRRFVFTNILSLSS